MSNELYHHGILGQKWGVRRYQNKDGSLTKAGKRRAQADSENEHIKNLSDNDMRSAISRKKLEDEYRSAMGLTPEAKKGKSFISTVGDKLFDKSADATADLIAQGGKAIGAHFMNKAINSILETDSQNYVYTNNQKKK